MTDPPLQWQCHVQYRRGVPQPPKNFLIEIVGNVRPHERAVAVRVGPTSVVPSRFTAWVVLAEPRVRVDLELVVLSATKPVVRELTVTPSVDGAAPITTTTLRRVLVDPIVKAVMDKAAKFSEGRVIDRSDVLPGAFQLPGDPDDEFRLTPPTDQPNERVRQAAQIYGQAAAFGSRAPTEAVAQALNVSKAQASRYVRAAREANLLPPLGEPITDPTHVRFLGKWNFFADSLKANEEALSAADSEEDRAEFAGRVEDFRRRLRKVEADWRNYRETLRARGLNATPLPAGLAALDDPQ